MSTHPNVSSDNRLPITILAVLTVTVLLTGGLAVYLTLTREREPGSTISATGEPRIAFISDRDGEPAVYVMAADGSDPQRVSEVGKKAGPPSWSPDGQRVAYLAQEADEEDELYAWVTTADGSEHIRVSQTISRVLGILLTWSPDGALLTFVAEGEPVEGGDFRSVVHLARSDGTGIERSIVFPLRIYRLVWSPTGDDLLIVGGTAAPEVVRADVTARRVYVMSKDGENVTEIFRGAWAADWSPDGMKIVIGDQMAQRIIILGRDRELHQAIELPGEYPTGVVWSPNGTHVAVITSPNSRSWFEVGITLNIITLETGKVITIVDSTEDWVAWSDWSPDGEHLLFTTGPMRKRAGAPIPWYGDLWVYDVTSGQLEQLTVGEPFDGWGVWSP